MKDTDINIAIAEVRGWNFIPEHNFDGPFGLIAVPQHWDNPDDNGLEDEPPNYCADLNAIAEAREAILSQLPYHKGWEQFDTHLLHIAAEAHEHTTTSVIMMLRADARQNCEALLRTIGKWKE